MHPFCYVIQEKPSSRELCVKCSSRFRGIHKACLTTDDLHVLSEEGVFCSVCTANKKKRTLTFPSNSQRYPPLLHINNSPFCSFLCSEESTKAPGFHEAKRPRKQPSQKAKDSKRKREIEKIFSQQEISETGAKLPHTSSETDSDIEFEVGGSMKSTRYKLLYMFTYYISGRNVCSLICLFIFSVKLNLPTQGNSTPCKRM